MARVARTWQVLLIGGASGSGKTSVSYRLARHFDVGITEVDDFQIVLERMTNAELLPEIHFWRTHPDAVRSPANEIVAHLLAQSRVISTALEAVIANHLESQMPVIFEGDFILPALAAQTSFCGVPNDERVRAVVIDEDDEQQLIRNFLQRESALQPERARVSWLHGRWLKQQGEASGAAVIASRPWATLFERVIRAIT